MHNTTSAVIGQEELRSNDVKGRLYAYEFATFLPCRPEQGARRVVTRLENRLQGFTAATGVAAFSRSARAAEKLVQSARHDAQPPPDNVIDFNAFRYRHKVAKGRAFIPRQA